MKGHFVLTAREEPCLALAEGHGLAPSRLHLAHEKDPYTDQEEHGKPGYKDGLP
jgi:hypothetical protein